MPTIIYPSPIFGPVKSRRLGISLGINLLPADKRAVSRLFRIPEKKMKRADRLIQKYGYWSAALSFLPAIGEVILVALGIMRVNKYKVIAVMTIGKFARYAFVVASFYGVARMFA